MSRRRRSVSLLTCPHIWTLKRPCMLCCRWPGSRVDSWAFMSIWMSLRSFSVSFRKRRGLPFVFFEMASKLSETFSKRMTSSR